jgi:hypothetical protein
VSADLVLAEVDAAVTRRLEAHRQGALKAAAAKARGGAGMKQETSRPSLPGGPPRDRDTFATALAAMDEVVAILEALERHANAAAGPPVESLGLGADAVGSVVAKAEAAVDACAAMPADAPSRHPGAEGLLEAVARGVRMLLGSVVRSESSGSEGALVMTRLFVRCLTGVLIVHCPPISVRSSLDFLLEDGTDAAALLTCVVERGEAGAAAQVWMSLLGHGVFSPAEVEEALVEGVGSLVGGAGAQEDLLGPLGRGCLALAAAFGDEQARCRTGFVEPEVFHPLQFTRLVMLLEAFRGGAADGGLEVDEGISE